MWSSILETTTAFVIVAFLLMSFALLGVLAASV